MENRIAEAGEAIARPASNFQGVVADFFSLQVGLFWFISLYLG
jgi:hypothetical protein